MAAPDIFAGRCGAEAFTAKHYFPWTCPTQPSGKADKLDVEDDVCVWGHAARETPRAVRPRGLHVQPHALVQTHQPHALIEAADHLPAQTGRLQASYQAIKAEQERVYAEQSGVCISCAVYNVYSTVRHRGSPTGYAAHELER
eukprot:6202186-Pleurochrysis_carterae.AAC.1